MKRIISFSILLLFALIVNLTHPSFASAATARSVSLNFGSASPVQTMDISNWQIMDKTVPVNIDKSWKINFSSKVKPATVNDNNIYVQKVGSDVKIPVYQYLDYNNTTVEIVPKSNYESDSSYSLYITGSLQNVSDKYLKQPVKLNFKTKATGQPVEFLGNLMASASDLFTNESSDVIFRITLKVNPNIVTDGVKLYQTDSLGNIQTQKGILEDNGDSQSGDDIANDSVYGLKVNFSPTQEGKLYFKVIAESDAGQAATNVLVINVLDPLTTAQISQVDTISNDTVGVYDNAVKTLPADQVDSATVDWLKQQPEVQTAGISDNLIWYQLNSGVSGGMFTGNLDNTDGTSGKSVDSATRDTDEKRMPTLLLGNTSDNSSIKASLMSPTFTQFSNRTPATIFEDSLDALSTNLNIDFSKTYNSLASVEAFKSLDNYNLVVIHTHGGVFKDQVINLTGTLATSKNIKKYQADLRANPARLMIVSAEGQSWLAVTPAFIAHYNTSFPNSIVYGGFCDSLVNHSMADAYLDNGAQTYFGFSNTVRSIYNDHIGSEVFRSLITDVSTTGQAFKNATDLHGKNDGYLASFIIDGKNDIGLAGSSLSNGSFETGSTSGWGRTGDVRVIQKLAELKPTQGDYMAILSTGLGSEFESTSNITQTFCVPSNASKISFDINFVSEEPMEYVGSMFDDKLRGYIYDVNQSSEYTLIDESINQSVWYPVYGVDFDGGDHTTYETKFKHIEYDVSKLRGHVIDLIFKVWDVGDSLYDSAALIDNIRIE